MVVCVEGSIQERWVLPALLATDKDEIAGVHGQRRDVVDKLAQFDAFSAEFVQVSQPLIVVFGHKSPRPDLKTGD